MMDTKQLMEYSKRLKEYLSQCYNLQIVSDLSLSDFRECVVAANWNYIHVKVDDIFNNDIFRVSHRILQMAEPLTSLGKEIDPLMGLYYSKGIVTDIMEDELSRKVFNCLNEAGQYVIHLHPNEAVMRCGNLVQLLGSIELNQRYKNLRFVTLVTESQMIKSFAIRNLNQTRIMNDSVFISYSWREPSNHIVENNIQTALSQNNISYVLDKNDCNYMTNIPEFEKELAHGMRIVAVISAPYVKSIQCMYEMALMFERGEVSMRVLLVSLDDFNRNDRDYYNDVVNYWQTEKLKNENMLASLPDGAKMPYEQDIEYIRLIIKHIGEFWTFLRNENTLTLTELGKNEFKQLIDKLGGSNPDKTKTAEVDSSIDPFTGSTSSNIVITQNGANSQVVNITGDSPVTINNTFGNVK